MSTANNPKCTILDASNVCGSSYQGYPVLASEFKSTAEFNAFMKSKIMNSTDVIETHRQLFGCSGLSEDQFYKTSRYTVSWQCSFIVHDAIKNGCSVGSLNPAGPSLCQEQCAMASTTTDSIVDNDQYCPSGTAEQQLRKTEWKKSVASECAKNQLGPSQCVTGMNIEARYCGFRSEADARAGCKAFNDRCCRSLLNGSGKSGESLGAGAIAGIVVGVLAALALAICAYVFWQKRRLRSRSDNSDEEEGDIKKNAVKPKNEKKAEIAAMGSTVPAENNKRLMTKSELIAENVADAMNHYPPKQVNHQPVEFAKRTQSLPRKATGSTDPTETKRNSEAPTVLGSPVIGGSVAAAVKDRKLTNISEEWEKDSINAKEKLGTIIDDEEEEEFEDDDVIEMLVEHEYKATQPDELTLLSGHRIFVVKRFEDGWALGVDIDTGDKGAFPMVCVAPNAPKKNVASEEAIKSPAPSTESGTITKRVASAMILPKDLARLERISKRPFSQATVPSPLRKKANKLSTIMNGAISSRKTNSYMMAEKVSPKKVVPIKPTPVVPPKDEPTKHVLTSSDASIKRMSDVYSLKAKDTSPEPKRMTTIH